MSYDVLWQGDTVGRAEIVPAGLYCHIRCRCNGVSGIFRLVAQTEKGDVSIGILGPGEKGLELERAVPAKKMGQSAPCFRLEDKNDSLRFYPLDPEKPCPIADRLEEARFVVRNGVPGLVLKADSADHQ